jgi:hypothetical protein
MKNPNLRSLLLLAATSAIFAASDAEAALPYTDGDLLLSFRATGGQGATTDYLVNLGSIATFANANTPLTLSVGNIDADLDNIFGSNWSSRPDLLWSVSGVQFAAGNGLANRTLIASQSQGTPITLGTANSTPWTRATLSTQGAPALRISDMAGKFAVGTTGPTAGVDQMQSANSSVALIQPISQSNSFRSYMPGGSLSNASSAYLYFADADGIEGNFALGPSGSALDLYVMQPGSGAGTFEGTLSVGSNAELTFTPTGVPEPTSALLLLASASALGFSRLRRRA